MTDPFQAALARHLDFMDARDAKMLGVSWQYILEEESKRVEAVTRGEP